MSARELLANNRIQTKSTAPGRYYTTCPQCSEGRTGAHKKAKVLGVTIEHDSVSWGCNHCGWTGGDKINKANGGARAGFAATHDYTDENGTLIAQKVRNWPGHEPKCWWRHPDGGGAWLKGAGGAHMPLYRLPELIEDLAQERTILIVEGEKDVDSLRAIRVPATCNPDGAAKPKQKPKWRPEHSEVLRGADVVIIPDHDEQGYAHADAIVHLSAQVAKRVRLLKLADHWPQCPKGGDVSDWLAAGHNREQLYELIERAREPTKDAPADDDGAPLDCEPWWCDAENIPPREFLYMKHFARGNIGASIGAGGRAKTSRGLYEAVEMVLGRNLATNETLPAGPLRVLCLNAEEEQAELDRRLAAIMQRFKITKADLGGRLFVKSVRGRPLRFATMMNGTATLSEPALAKLASFVKRERIDVWMLDPWVSFHAVRESDNADQDLVIKQGLGRIAQETNSAGEIFHHPGKPKPGGQETTVEDARGASAIVYAARSARVFNFMVPDEAAKLGIREADRRLHIRIANGKANLGPLGKADWIKIEVENLPNGDEVACATSWTPPNPFDGITTLDREGAANLAQGGAYRANAQSPEWYGWALAKMLNIPVSHGDENNDPKQIARLKSIIKTWIKNKVLKVEPRKDENRKPRKYIVPGSGDAGNTPNDQETVEANDDDLID
ncbi:MAG: AAA family ATPase [Hyphomicrobiales bacterium]|nr:AAA family ATPase [Hyphomicrobiales bacterium]